MANTTGNKYGGRQKGTPNRITKELRSLLKDVMYDEIGALKERLDALNPKERVELLIKLMPYALPKVTSVSHTTNEPLDWDL
ncbi:hypothetical protein N9K49_06810 [Flavobacteriaceae bacterium]|nr:hypothetical protein [Flavobacteriaceae bacterium]